MYPANITVAKHVAQAAATVTSNDIKNNGARGLKLIIDITNITGTLTVTIQGKDPVSGKVWTLLASAALGSVATTVLTLYPGAAVSANVSGNDVLPSTWNVKSVVATGPCTATIAAELLA